MAVVIFLISFLIMPNNFWPGLGLVLLTFLLPTGYYVYVYYWGQALAMRGQVGDAIRHYTRLLNMPTVNKAMVYARRAGLRNAIGDMDGAIADYSKAIQHTEREDPALYGIRSALYLGKREFEKALDDTNRLLELHPRAEVGYANRATARMYLGDVKGAIDDCNQGLELDNSASGAALLYNNRGTAHRLSSDFTQAMSDYNLAMSTSLNPQQKKMVHPTILSNQGILYYLKEEYDQARAYFQQSTGMNPDFLKGRAGLAVTRFKLGQDDKAREMWRELSMKKHQYRDPAWLQRELNWPMPMMADAADLIETL
jgi:tetratricopeptide (TPR) repeat protein